MTHISALEELLTAALQERNQLNAYIANLKDTIEARRRMETTGAEIIGMQVAVPAVPTAEDTEAVSGAKVTQRKEDKIARIQRLKKALKNPRVSTAEFSDDDISFIKNGPLLRIWNKKKRDEAKAEQPEATEEPRAEQPEATEEPRAEQPEAIEEPKADESEATEEPRAEQPEATEEPRAEQPEATEEPRADESEATEEPRAEQPEATEEPRADKPEATEEPRADESEVTEKPKVSPACMPQKPTLHVQRRSEATVEESGTQSTKVKVIDESELPEEVVDLRQKVRSGRYNLYSDWVEILTRMELFSDLLTTRQLEELFNNLPPNKQEEVKAILNGQPVSESESEFTPKIMDRGASNDSSSSIPKGVDLGELQKEIAGRHSEREGGYKPKAKVEIKQRPTPEVGNSKSGSNKGGNPRAKSGDSSLIFERSKAQLEKKLKDNILKGVVCELKDEEEEVIQMDLLLRIMKKIMLRHDFLFTDSERRYIGTHELLMQLLKERPSEENLSTSKPEPKAKPVSDQMTELRRRYDTRDEEGHKPLSRREISQLKKADPANRISGKEAAEYNKKYNSKAAA
ncbi:hypothetical protein MK805_13200 [Shimazuella sp. AN120528]|uniref:hypothetical protein n=1 Tax=Shimazuella soli TaxID=1892854 RepID=UPI001F0FB6DE|nr:hypothetical protein [Shimazuella soli]MCH5585897.1 hypothetical protein [Shimazuella soli]